MIVPEHRTALGTEASFRGSHLGGFIVFVKGQRSDVDPVPSAYNLTGDALDLVFTSDDVNGIVVAHNID